MGRLFWKFFFFIWLAQLAAIIGLATIFTLERERDAVHWKSLQENGQPFHPSSRPPPGMEPPPHPGIHRGPPPPPHPRLPFLPLLVCTLVSLIFAALLAWYFAKPIRQLRQALAAAATGNLTTRLASDMRRNDELADLGREFDRMASQLQSLMDGQRRLLHDVSHELRSPLARLQASTGLLRQQPEKTESCIERIERESVRMNVLVGELLTLSRLEAGVTGKMDETIAMDELLADIVDDARFEAETSERKLSYRNSSGGVCVRGNGELLHRALENVVRNALHHTPKDTPVHVEVIETDDASRICLSVEDEGDGVPDSALETIFEPFFRANSSDSSSGHGLGLAIARRVVEAHGGRISAQNRPSGGLRIELSLPVA